MNIVAEAGRFLIRASGYRRLLKIFILPRSTAIFVDDAKAVADAVGAGVFGLIVVGVVSMHTVVVTRQRAIVDFVEAAGDRQRASDGEQRQ